MRLYIDTCVLGWTPNWRWALKMKMSTVALLVGSLSLAAQAAGSAPLCAGWDNPIEEDHQIRESDLTSEAAAEAKAFLEARPSPREGVLLDFEARNQEKILKGYSLKQAAYASGKHADRKAFCTWLTKEGFWYD